jgi:hypothetical protein
LKRRLRLLGRGNFGWTNDAGSCTIAISGSTFGGDLGASATDWLMPSNQRSGSNKCINGYFTQDIIPYTGSMSSTYLGAAVIRITG